MTKDQKIGQECNLMQMASERKLTAFCHTYWQWQETEDTVFYRTWHMVSTRWGIHAKSGQMILSTGAKEQICRITG